jgi:hypothetical protein
MKMQMFQSAVIVFLTMMNWHLWRLVRQYQRQLREAMEGWKKTIAGWEKQLVEIDRIDAMRTELYAYRSQAAQALRDLTVTRES